MSERYSKLSGLDVALETLAIAAQPEGLKWAIEAALGHRANDALGTAVDEHLALLAVRERFAKSLGARWQT